MKHTKLAAIIFIVGLGACEKKKSGESDSAGTAKNAAANTANANAPALNAGGPAATAIKPDATCAEAAAAMVPPQAKADGSGAKIEGFVLATCQEMPWTAAERGCLASVAGDVERCEASIGQERLQAIFENVRAKMKGPDQPAPSDVAAPPKDAKKSKAGVFYKVQKAGSGKAHPTASSTVTVHYTGWTTDGKMFDSSVSRGEPAQFPLSGVIAGWTDGLQVMVEGETTRFWIPEELAYKGQPGAPAGMLVFDVELIKIDK